MKKSIIISLLTLITTGLICNPIALPPIMSEFYIVNESEWFLEIYIDPIYGDYFQENNTLDGLEISSSSGSAVIKEGISFNVGEIIIITQDSMQSLVQFDRNGDLLQIENVDFGIGEYYNFGNVLGAQITALAEGQSLVLRRTTCNGYEEYTYYLCKDAMPGIGNGPYTTTNALGLYSGKIYDMNDNPIFGISIGNDYLHFPYVTCGSNLNFSVTTDDEGYFSFDEYAAFHRTNIFFNTVETIILLDSTIIIEPGIDNYFEFHLDTIFSGKQTISIAPLISFEAFPNPTDNDISFNIEFINTRIPENALIKIYNLSGEIVKILPVKTNFINSSTANWDWSANEESISAGQYICKLEFDGKVQAETKFIISK
jgi:hypothetical protein